MPTYDFLDQNTGDIFEKQFSGWKEKDAFLAENPHLVQTYTKPPAIAGDHITIKKDTGFKEVLQKINERVPGGMKQSGSTQL